MLCIRNPGNKERPEKDVEAVGSAEKKALAGRFVQFLAVLFSSLFLILLNVSSISP